MEFSQRQLYHYYAFISYSSADEMWAKWLQNRLENYRLPTAVRKESIDIPKRINPVFRDATDLSTGILENVLRKELESSKYLVVICSPAAAKSDWVNAEVSRFIEMGREESIIPIVVEGEPFSSDPAKEAFPPALRTMEQELIGISVARYGRREAFLRVVAALLGIRYDKLAMRDRRRTRIRRLAAGVTAMAAAAAIGCGVWYNLPHSKYYSAYAYRNEIPYGICELSEREREGLHHSFKITTQRGKVVSLERVNSMDALTVPVLGFPTVEDSRIEYSYDDSGRLIQVENYDTYNVLHSAEALTYDDSNHRIAIDFRANSDSIDAYALAADLSYAAGTEGDEKSEITRQINTYNEDGYLIKSEFMRDNLGTRASDSNGVYGKAYEYDELGQIVRISNLDNSGQVYNCKYGWAVIALEYDERGQIVSEMTYDAEGNPARNASAAVRVEYEYDENGNLASSCVTDENGVLTDGKDGIAQRAFLYDGGLCVAEYYGGADGKMAANENGVCAQQYVYDELGRVCGIIYLDDDLNPTDSPVKGYSAEYYTLDENGRIVRSMLFDREFRQVCDPKLGSHAFEYAYDSFGNSVGCRYLDTELQLAMNPNGYAAWQAETDDSGRTTRIEFLDEQGNLSCFNAGNSAACEYEYDAFGNPTVQRFFDESNVLVEVWEQKFENGHLVSLRCYDGSGQPILGELGAYEGRMEYDAKGNRIRTTYYDADGRLMAIDSGFAVCEYEYDAYGNEILLKALDENLEPVYRPFWKIESRYDSRNNLIRKVRYGKDTASNEVTVYRYNENDRLLGISVYDGYGNLISTEGELVELF